MINCVNMYEQGHLDGKAKMQLDFVKYFVTFMFFK